MREIKFRVREIFNSVESLGWSYFTLGDLACSNFSTNHKEFMGDTWTQYTGLKDKNGVDIYEGDIIKYLKGRLIEPEESPYELEEVKWIADGFAVEKACSLCELNEDCEVIGNIYENPELLKGNLK